MATMESPATEQATYVPPLVELYLEDLAVTTLLRLGRPLKSTEIVAAADGVTLPRTILGDALKGNPHLVHTERDWNLAARTSRQHLSREERDRQPLETTLADLLIAIGKPLPVPVLARELTFLRGAFQANFKDLAKGALQNARWAVEVAPDFYVHNSLILDTHAPTEELIIRANGLADNPDFEYINEIALPPASGNVQDDLVGILRATGHPLSHKMLGFLAWKVNSTFDSVAGERALANRAVFTQFVGGYVTLTETMNDVRGEVQAWSNEISGGAPVEVDVAAILRQRNVQHTAAPRDLKADIIDDLKELARRSSGQPVALGSVMTDVLEIEPEDPQFAPTLQSLNDRLRSDTDFLPVGIGQFLLRESIPTYVGETPEELRPIQLSVRNPETDEPLDFEMSDDGLEGDAADFVHAPEWDDVGEEAEVKLVRRQAATSEVPTSLRYVILNHHYRAGTIKLRRADEEFFGIASAFTRLNVFGPEGAVEAWASRESGIIYGLGKYYKERTPISGGVLNFVRDGSRFNLQIEANDKLTALEGSRAEELENLREAANYMSLYELLQTIMREHGGGMELSTLWAEVNTVRRTSKRLLCSVLSGYHCYYFKQRGPKQFLWRFDADKLDQGFMRNKRKYVRR